MPRQPRAYLPGHPHHIVQRGHNRAPCFRDPEDRRVFLRLLRHYGQRHGVAIHAYCLMTNHYHLLVTPESVASIPGTLQVVSGTYAQYVNRRYARTGTLWEGRHHASIVQTERYLLACYRYIEMNPVRAGIARKPHDYPWSSHLFNAGGETGWLVPHPVYLALGRDPQQRGHRYRRFFESPEGSEELASIRSATRASRPLAEAAFQQDLERRLGLRFSRERRGRPSGSPTRVPAGEGGSSGVSGGKAGSGGACAGEVPGGKAGSGEVPGGETVIQGQKMIAQTATTFTRARRTAAEPMSLARPESG